MLGTPGSLDVVLSRTYAEAAAGESEELSDERYISALTALIRDLAAHNDVVIIGRGSQAILAETPDVLHVLLVAPLRHRIESLAGREGTSKEAAMKREHDGAKSRSAFHRKFFGIDVNDSSSYHLTFNTARLTQDEITGLIAFAATRLTAKPAP
jgi:cytidylate kinase